MEKKVVLILISILLVLPLMSANLGTFEPCKPLDIKTILNTSSVNISTLNYPNGSIIVSNQQMTNVAGKTFNYTLYNTCTEGTYNYDYYDGEGNTYVNSFKIGYDIDLGVIIAFIIAAALLFYVSTLFAKEQKGIKTLLIMFGLGFILLTIQIAKSAIPVLRGVMNAGLIMGLILLMFMLAYFMIIYTKEIFQNVRNSWSKKQADSFGEAVQ